MSDRIIVRNEGRVRILVNNNPTARNAISADFYTALPEALAEAQADASVGAIVLTGAEGFFSAGGDLRQLATRRELPEAERRARLEGLHDMIRAIRDCGKPVIAAVEGGAAGAGVSLAMACDLLVMARGAYFSVAYVKVGLTPDGGATAFLSQVLPRQLLVEMCLTGDKVGAERLASLGAVNRLVDAGSAENEAITLAARLAQGPAQAMRRIKHLCHHAYDADVEAQLELEAWHMVTSLGGAESAEGIGAFLQKRPANFAGMQ